MEPTYSEPLSFGNLELVPGTRYRVALPFRDYDGGLHEPLEEWLFRGYDFLPHDDGLTLYVRGVDESDRVIRLSGNRELQAGILEAFDRYVAPA
jgi:hypothetical protein